MKIAILTQPLHVNYGGLLQAFALQKVLHDFGHEVVTENGRKKQSAMQVLKELALRYAYPIVHKFRPDLSKNEKNVQNSKTFREIVCVETSQFIENYIKTVGYISREDAAKYDAFVVGSDQVWRPRYNNDQSHLFLDFSAGLGVKRVAYAASFGTDSWEFTPEETEVYGKLTRSFEAISVRESSGVSLCKEHWGVDAVHVVDPTLLLTAGDYKKLIKDQAPSGKRLTTYILDETNEKRGSVKKMARELNSDVNNLFVPQKDSKGNPQPVPGVETWLSGIANADYVITDSFHGTVFSILFKRNFIVIANAQRGASRMESLLDMLELKERMVLTASEITNERVQKPIDWETTQRRIDELRKNSIMFLHNCGF